MEQEAIQGAVVVGHSVSGVWLQLLAVQAAERISRVVFLDAIVLKNGESFVSNAVGPAQVKALHLSAIQFTCSSYVSVFCRTRTSAGNTASLQCAEGPPKSPLCGLCIRLVQMHHQPLCLPVCIWGSSFLHSSSAYHISCYSQSLNHVRSACAALLHPRLHISILPSVAVPAIGASGLGRLEERHDHPGGQDKRHFCHGHVHPTGARASRTPGTMCSSKNLAPRDLGS